MKQYAIVDLKGGLGNQIFQIAYALYLQSLGIKAVVDTHFFLRICNFLENWN